jgi:transcription antitermination factor NusG
MVETFAPRVKTRRHVPPADGADSAAIPLFPRYIFARFQVNLLPHKINFTRGVDRVASFGDGPAPVDDEIIAIIQAQTAGDGFVEPGEGFKYGDTVKIEEGPFSSLTGIFERGHGFGAREDSPDGAQVSGARSG